MQNDWIMEFDTKVFTILKTKLKKKYTTKYPYLYVTSSDQTTETPIFPTVYIHQMGGIEKGRTMEGNDVNGFECTFQVEVTTNTTQEDAREVMREVVNIMKSMQFFIVTSPEFKNVNNLFRQVVRFRRNIGSNDNI